MKIILSFKIKFQRSTIKNKRDELKLRIIELETKNSFFTTTKAHGIYFTRKAFAFFRGYVLFCLDSQNEFGKEANSGKTK